MQEIQRRAEGLALADEADKAGGGSKISREGRVVLIIVAIVLDLIDVFSAEIPISDVLATIISVVLFLYFFYIGISQVRPFVMWGLAYLAEWIPIVDLFPLYLIGMIAVILIDRSAIAKAVVTYIPTGAGAAGKVAGGAAQKTATRTSERLARNKMFGAASGKTEKIAQRYIDKYEEVKNKVPGKLRRAASTVRTTYQSRSIENSGPSRPNPDEVPFPDTYIRYERELLPELEDVVDIDVTGENQTPKPPLRNTPKNGTIGS